FYCLSHCAHTDHPSCPTRRSSDLDVENGSASSDLEDILSSAAGPQEASLTLGTATNWYMVLATFLPPTTSNPTTTTTTLTTTTRDRKSTRLNSSHQIISYAVCCLK